MTFSEDDLSKLDELKDELEVALLDMEFAAETLGRCFELRESLADAGNLETTISSALSDANKALNKLKDSQGLVKRVLEGSDVTKEIPF